jgi:ZIP family zinc transporter
MDSGNIIFAFSLTLLAGLSTGIGSALSILAKKTNPRLLAVGLGFSAGVMIYVSFVEIFPKSRNILIPELGERYSFWATTGAFFAGMFFAGLIDWLIPNFENPHEAHKIEEIPSKGDKTQLNASNQKLMRMGLFSALAITIHNFPEGFATFASALKSPIMGISIAVAIAIHNIPEGVAVAVPIYYATGNRKKAFLYSFLSGLSEPLGAIIGFFLLRSILNDLLFGMIFASVAGIMVYISLDELLPTAEKYGEHHVALFGLISGMLVMALSLMLFA